MIELDNRTNLELNEILLSQITDSLTDKDIELIVTTNEEIQEINLTNRNINKPTDVLSFPYEEMPMSPLGSIVISKDFVEESAKNFAHDNISEFTLLYIHGLLHLLGYDHEVDNGEMREEERRLIEKFNLPSSLIIRTQG
ncbi:rRNA maturation RNase YbeY [Sulfurimonas aquatica]|uniref:Endoribonuclease YbeY n=1 Tax=Sulfurimonas aquatica TaxID=2672570 RepID=A0A975GCZ5_9BACT|nr:rRNA maturation RNase YbeY [Sulfurimonas aquatica]QSZ41784.1 rRNA maturation RNase YbeY [Sulfurimonas aquatica]